MPYKNPEDKRRWEREHREQRNAQRRKRLAAPIKPILAKPVHDRVSAKETESDWRIILGLAVGLGVVLLAAFSGIDVPVQTTNRTS
jgi:hypothetical protein